MIAQKGGEDIKQVVIRLSDDVHAKLKLKTVKENTSIQDVVERFIKFYVQAMSLSISILKLQKV